MLRESTDSSITVRSYLSVFREDDADQADGGPLFAGKIAIPISHRLSTVRRAEQIIVTGEGKVVETGNHESLLNLNGLHARLFELQARGYRQLDPIGSIGSIEPRSIHQPSTLVSTDTHRGVNARPPHQRVREGLRQFAPSRR